MADEFTAGDFTYPDVEEALERMQSILLSRVEAKPGPEVDREYRLLRRGLMSTPIIGQNLPRLVTVNSDLGGVWHVLKDASDQWEPRRHFVREQMRGALDAARAAALNPQVPSSGWTGIGSPREKLTVARKLLPLAQATVAGLIAELERPQGNGGPPLDERAEAIENLRELHRVIGELLSEVERQAVPSLSQRLLDEAAGYLTRFAQSVRNDPMPYMVSAGLFSVLAVIGAGPVGGFLAGIASRIKKNTGGGS